MEILVSTVTQQQKAASLRYWYGASISEFIATSPKGVLGHLASNSRFPIILTQRDAWLNQIEFLQSQLEGVAGSIFFEFNIPRMGRRIDVILVIEAAILALEFKVGGKFLDRTAIDQVWDYGLDLKNFHEASHNASIVPILIATEAVDCGPIDLISDPDKLYRPIFVNPKNLRKAIDLAYAKISGDPVSAEVWARASYHPTPTIVEAARALYAQHSV